MVGDLFAEVVALAEDFAAKVDDVLGVGVVFAKDEGLRDKRATGEKLGERIAEGLQDGADLIFHHDRAIEFLGGEGEVVVELFPPELAGLLLAAIDVETVNTVGA